MYDCITEARRVILRHEIGNADATVDLIALLREVTDCAADAPIEAEKKYEKDAAKIEAARDDHARQLHDAKNDLQKLQLQHDQLGDANETLRAQLQELTEKHNAVLATLREVDVTDREMPVACIQQVLAEYTDW